MFFAGYAACEIIIVKSLIGTRQMLHHAYHTFLYIFLHYSKLLTLIKKYSYILSLTLVCCTALCVYNSLICALCTPIF